MRCPRCDLESPDTSRFCAECGTKLVRLTNKTSPSDSETLQVSVNELTTGTFFAGRYQVIEELGKGGMGKVYKVLDTELNEKVALKLLKPEVATDSEIIERFRNELKMARQISHKNVCRMYHLTKEAGTYYITMEYISGEDLKKLFRKVGQIPLGRAISIAKQVCEGLAEAHGFNVVHRDLKPQNIMMDDVGNVKIMDFGIARSTKTKGLTGVGVMIGTPEYMSPEQAEGQDIDQRSDIYSLGVILFEMVTGRVPFEGDTALSIALKHKSETPVNPKDINPQLPEEFAALILKCMEKDKQKRYQDSRELLSEFNKIEKEIPTTKRVIIEKKLEEKEMIDTKQQQSIAVLPFGDLSTQRDQEYFCEGLAEELINALSKIKDLRVVARTSAFAFKGEKIDIREMGKKLNVAAILEGSVRKIGSRLRISAQLINVADGFQVWSDRYDREIDDVFIIQDDISKAIVDALKIKLVGEEKDLLVKHPTNDIEAHILYLRGRHFSSMLTEQDLKKAMGYYYLAIAKDPEHAVAYAGLADHYSEMGFLGIMPPKDAYQKAEGMASKALEMDPTLAEAYSSRAQIKFWFEWNWNEAEHDFKRAIELTPGSAVTQMQYSVFLIARGRTQEAVRSAHRAVDLDPLSPVMNFNLGWIYFLAGMFDESIDQLKKTLELNPGHFWARGVIAWNYAFKQMFPEALAVCKKLEEIYSEFDPWLRTSLAYVFAVSGERSRAEKMLDNLVKFSSERYIDPFNFAALYAGLGEKSKAFEYLEKSFDNRSPFMVLARNFSKSWFKNLSLDEKYQEILKKIGF